MCSEKEWLWLPIGGFLHDLNQSLTLESDYAIYCIFSKELATAYLNRHITP